MSRREKTQLTAQMRRELEAIDAALAGEAVGAGDARLAELTRALRGLRPQPSRQFARALDARAARGFRRERPALARDGGPAGSNSRAGWQRRRTLLLFPALGLAVAVVVLAAVSLSSSGRHRAQPLPGAALSGRPALTPAVSAPAQAAPQTSRTRATEASPGAAAVGSGARQVERTSALEVGVAPRSIESASQRVFTLVSNYGGYVRQSNVSTGAGGGASFDIRLPTPNLALAIAALSHTGHVRSETDTTNDVTNQLSSLQRSLADLRAQRSSLLKQLAGATEARRAEQLRRQLQAIEARIGQTQGAIRALFSRVDYTRLALSLTPESSGAATTGGDLTPGGAAHSAAKILDAALAVLVIAAAAILPLAVVVTAGWIVVSTARRRLREQALDAS